MKYINLKSILVFFFFVTIVSCVPAPVKPPTIIVLVSPASTDNPDALGVGTETAVPDIAFSCKNTQLTSPMTEKQIETIKNRDYNFIYISENKSIENVYSINRADTLCAGENPSQVAEIVSGFIVGIDQPSGEKYPNGNNNGITYRYLRLRFIDKDGKEHDYWMRISGLTPKTDQFQIASWGKPISNGENVFNIFLKGRNSDGTESAANVSDIFPNQLIKINDQFIAILNVGYYVGEKFDTTNAFYQFMQATEGKASFPPSSEIILDAGALLVPSHP